MRSQFIEAIRSKKLVEIRFWSKDDSDHLTRKCAPMDVAPGKNIKDNIERFWVWDYESDEAPHTLGLKPEKIDRLAVLEETFDPAEFVTWTPDWKIARDWGAYS